MIRYSTIRKDCMLGLTDTFILATRDVTIAQIVRVRADIANERLESKKTKNRERNNRRNKLHRIDKTRLQEKIEKMTPRILGAFDINASFEQIANMSELPIETVEAVCLLHRGHSVWAQRYAKGS